MRLSLVQVPLALLLFTFLERWDAQDQLRHRCLVDDRDHLISLVEVRLTVLGQAVVRQLYVYSHVAPLGLRSRDAVPHTSRLED